MGDQKTIFPHNITFEHPEQQEEYVRNWVRKRTDLPCDFSIRFYQGRYAAEKGSILPVGDPTAYVPKEEVSLLHGSPCKYCQSIGSMSNTAW